MSMSRLEAVLASIDAQAAATDQKLDQAQEFATRSEALRVTGKSGDEVAEVTVDGAGQISDVVVADDLQGLRGSQVGAAVLDALHQAQRRLAFHVEQLGTEIYGEGSPSVQAFSNAYRERFGYEEDDES